MLAVISHPDCLLHDPGGLYPDQAIRLEAINDRIIMSGLEFVIGFHDAPLATRGQLARAHDAAYIEHVFNIAPKEGKIVLDEDTVMSPGTLNAALRASGAGILGVDLVMSREASAVFCPVRPPGHHAERARAMGFCIFNNIAVAAAHAMAEHGIERVAIADFDVHHGNGTESIFKNDDRVLFCSSFQHPFYPYTGHESDARNLVDVPLAAGTDGKAFRKAVAEHWLPALDKFRPQFLLISAGFDAHVLDDMSGLMLKESDYAWVTRELAAIAEEHAGGRIVSMLEGGYEPDVLARCVASHLNALLD
jgi:acetoin utilization deacetylase AcuC-like enzyme